MSDIISAIKQICEEKGLSYESVIATIESALAAAYRKDYGEKNQNIRVEYDPATNQSRVYDIKTVVEDLPPEEERPEGEEGDEVVAEEVPLAEGEEEGHRFNPKNDIEIKDALLIDPKLQIGDELKQELPTKDEYGRMAAQTAKQVIIQRLREAERDMVFGEFKDKEGEVVSGIIQRREGRIVLVDLGKATGVILPEDQIRGERYNHNDRIKVYVREVRSTPKGPEILLSRTSDEILKKVFYLEIPEVANGLIEIKAVAREAGSRSKVAVEAYSENIDPIGSCVGQRGSRIQTIIRELGGEKIDIIEYSENASEFIAFALSPAKISSVVLNEEQKRALVKVAEDQLSLAIGKSGQNVRLAAYLTGWKIDIVEAATGQVKESSEAAIAAAAQDEAAVAETELEEKAVMEANSETDEPVVAEAEAEIMPEIEGEVEAAAEKKPKAKRKSKKSE
ncbi:MAG: transcription termination factor NusA [Candidatus Falkowbacteria bacterium]